MSFGSFGIDGGPFVLSYISFPNKYVAEFLAEYKQYLETDGKEININGDNVEITLSSDTVEFTSFVGYSNKEAIENCLFFFDYGGEDNIECDVDIIKNGLLALWEEKDVQNAWKDFVLITKFFWAIEVFNTEIGVIYGGGQETQYDFERNITAVEMLDYSQESVCLIGQDTLRYFSDPNSGRSGDSKYIIDSINYKGQYYIPDYVKVIGNGAFSCSVREIILPENVLEIRANAFSECDLLTRVWIPPTAMQIAPSAFVGIEKNVVIVAKPESYVAKYAKSHGIKVIYPGETINEDE